MRIEYQLGSSRVWPGGGTGERMVAGRLDSADSDWERRESSARMPDWQHGSGCRAGIGRAGEAQLVPVVGLMHWTEVGMEAVDFQH